MRGAIWESPRGWGARRPRGNRLLVLVLVLVLVMVLVLVLVLLEVVQRAAGCTHRRRL